MRGRLECYIKGWMDGIGSDVIIGHRYSKSTFGANNEMFCKSHTIYNPTVGQKFLHDMFST